jgi:hypothetical protein
MDEFDAMAIVKEESTLLLENGTLSGPNDISLWEGLASDDGSNSSSGEETLAGLRFESSGEELRFVILISLYTLGAYVLQRTRCLIRHSTVGPLNQRQCHGSKLKV